MTTSITLRATKGSELTHNEVDANFTNLQTTADAAATAASPTLTGTVTLSGAITAAAWTTSGIGLKETARTLTDTSSSGTVAAVYTHKLGGNTLAASSATTFTDAYSVYITDPVAGSGATLTNKWSLGAAGNIRGDALHVTGNSTTAPAIVFRNTTPGNEGIISTDQAIRLKIANTVSQAFGAAALQVRSTALIGWSAGTDASSASDVKLYRDAAAVLSLQNLTTAQTFRVYGTYTDGSNYERASLSTTAGSGITLAAETAGTGGDNLYVNILPAGTGDVRLGPTAGAHLKMLEAGSIAYSLSAYSGATSLGWVGFSTNASTNVEIKSAVANSSILLNGSAAAASGSAAVVMTAGGVNTSKLGVRCLTELTTIAAAATTDTTIQLPANALILGVSVRVTTVVPDATDFTVGDAGSAARFSTAAILVAANSTDPGTKAGCYYNATATAVRLTFSGTPPATNTGRVRVTIHYIDVTPPTS